MKLLCFYVERYGNAGGAYSKDISQSLLTLAAYEIFKYVSLKKRGERDILYCLIDAIYKPKDIKFYFGCSLLCQSVLVDLHEKESSSEYRPQRVTNLDTEVRSFSFFSSLSYIFTEKNFGT